MNQMHWDEKATNTANGLLEVVKVHKHLPTLSPLHIDRKTVKTDVNLFYFPLLTGNAVLLSHCIDYNYCSRTECTQCTSLSQSALCTN